MKDFLSSVDVGMIGRTKLKPLCTFILISFSLCSRIHILLHLHYDFFIFVFIFSCIKASSVITNGIRVSGLKIYGRTKYYKVHKMKIKGISVQGGVDCSLIKM